MGDALQNVRVLASKQCRGGGGAHAWLLQLREDVKFGFEIDLFIYLFSFI